MTSLNIYNGIDSTSFIDATQPLNSEYIMPQSSINQSTFTGNDPSTSSPPGVETAGGTIAFQGGIETTGGIAFQSNSEIATSDVETGSQITDILNQIQLQRHQGEALLSEAYTLNHEAMIARMQGEYVVADALQKKANAMQKEGYDILEKIQPENMNSGRDISFEGSLSLTQCEKACAEKANGVKNTYILRHW